MNFYRLQHSLHFSFSIAGGRPSQSCVAHCSANTQSSSKLGDPAEIFSDTVNIYSYFSPEWVFQMSAQIACLNRIIVTLAAFGGFFSRVSFQMPFQAISMKGCIVTLITFVTLFSRIKLQICPQTACLNRCLYDDFEDNNDD